MCLILLASQISETYPLVLAANRDEFYNRPTAPMHFWKDDGNILAGRDLKQGGTWFAVHKNGRFAGLTNYRNPVSEKPDAPSRGQIILDFLSSNEPFDQYFLSRTSEMARYNGFNLLYGDRNTVYWYSNTKHRCDKIAAGIHGLSNRDLNTPWPKVVRAKNQFEQALNHPDLSNSLFKILSDRTHPPDPDLPDTGVGIAWERLLSPVFIQSPDYGTRSSLIMCVARSGRMHITERTYDLSSKDKAFTDRNFFVQS